MTLSPDPMEQIARARSDLRIGVPVILRHGDDALIMASVETLAEERLSDLFELGELHLVLTSRRAETLHIPAYDGDLVRLRMDSRPSAAELNAIADPSLDLATPMKGPFVCVRGGDVSLERSAIMLVKSARLLPSVAVVRIGHSLHAPEFSGLTMVNAAFIRDEVARYRNVINARLPLSVAERTKLHVFRPDNGQEEHYAVEIGQVGRNTPVLTRLHSACFTGDVLGSLKCDCGPQLNAALKHMAEAGSGVLLYLNQEGRGIGLANKMRAYALQNQGFDTVEANHRLGFEDDERDFRIGAQLLTSLGIKQVHLLTNNPAKMARLSACGIDVAARVPLKVGRNRFNDQYLTTKSEKSGHLF